MSAIEGVAAPSLLVAARGREAEHGLWRFSAADGRWQGRQLARVAQLSSLARHPHLPVVYGTASLQGEILAFRIDDDGAVAIGAVASGDDPCHVALDPRGRMLVATNYGTGTVTLQALAADGSFDGPPDFLVLAGQGPDPDRQEAAHPHQAVFDGDLLIIVDLGADRLRRYHVDPDKVGFAALSPAEDLVTPPGSGPRHMVMLPESRVAVGGELSATLIVGPASPPAAFESLASSIRPAPARTRSPRNYPGDIARSADGGFVYLANRGHDTIALFDTRQGGLARIDEVDAGIAWPQHLALIGEQLLIAGWDSDRVTAIPLAGGLFAGAAETLFACPGPGWLLPWQG